jgi:hypothetical protein
MSPEEDVDEERDGARRGCSRSDPCSFRVWSPRDIDVCKPIREDMTPSSLPVGLKILIIILESHLVINRCSFASLDAMHRPPRSFRKL